MRLLDLFKIWKDNHPIQAMCEILDLPRSSYYKTLDSTMSNREKKDIKLIEVDPLGPYNIYFTFISLSIFVNKLWASLMIGSYNKSNHNSEN